ncbi:hypothetical protein [Enterococcus sp. BWR-S5]|uniref:hypothetical protein n=1 Tax=Enterococcus sp. BWR-S5 TaxID=2787714 RepID=UPI001922146B|nr:hypothetical protein [Enterococcus sp. BWR-S5]MBL1224968.1 hypothetical protein [Enterococcus sp. BWR-S5]
MRVSRDKVNNETEDYVCNYTKEELFGTYDFITPLQQAGFFPQVPKESVWAISYEGEPFGLYRQKEKTSSYSSWLLNQINEEADSSLHFTYFSSEEERAKYLFQLHHGNKQKIYLAGYLDEYQEYSISEETEQCWRDILIAEKSYEYFDETENINESVALFKQIMGRPGMYVGKNRLDLVQIFLNGWSMHQKPLWHFNYDLKRWLFLTESAVGASSLIAWNSMYEIYGTTELAIEKFREFLHENEPTSIFENGRWETVNEHIASIETLASKESVEASYPYLDGSFDETVSDEVMHAEIIRQLRRIIEEPCEHIKVFIHTGRAVQQLRFFFDKGQGWEDGLSLNHLPEYYEKLVVLHSYIKLLKRKSPGAVIVTLEWQNQLLQVRSEAYQAPEFQFFYEQPPEEKFLLSHQFAAWKQREIDA